MAPGACAVSGSETIWVGKANIDGRKAVNAELVETTQAIDVLSSGPIPDPRWSTVDEAGHFHAVAADGSYPTLDRNLEHRECNGGCGGVCEGDGYEVAVWSCRACGEAIEPGTTPGPHYATIPGLKDWRLKYRTSTTVPGAGSRVSVRFEPDTLNSTVLFGFALVGDMTVQGAPGGGVMALVELFGDGLLGRIGPAPKVVGRVDKVLEQFIADAQVALAKLRKAEV
jgi:hypothetical protein